MFPGSTISPPLRCSPPPTPRAVALLLAGLGVLRPDVSAAQTPGSWNEPAALELVSRAIERRTSEVRDTALLSYTARGDGYVYFLLDAPEAGRQALVRTDQVAVDVYWRSPNQVRQRIVGLREQRELPVTRLYYYLDRLTVVQDNYGQSIVIADGDNVNDVPHPVGTGAEQFYDYALGEALTLRLTGLSDPVQVREVRVRPRDPGIPAIVGSVFLDAATGALVRMTFTFTPSAYVDPRLDFINVTLENGLWRGRYWLPHEQRLEIRREMPELDLPFGTVIRTRMRIGDYQFNRAVPEALFASPLPITMAPRAQREAFAFDRPIDAEWRVEGFGRPISVSEIRREARSIVRDQALSGLPSTRLALGTASEVFRFNRAEGAVLGAGVSVRPHPKFAARFHGGWAIGAGHPLARLELRPPGTLGWAVDGYLNRLRDLGAPPISGAANTLGALLFGTDFTDPFYATGATVTMGRSLGIGWTGEAGVRLERQRSALLTTSQSLLGSNDPPRPVREIDAGEHVSVALRATTDARTGAGGWLADGKVTAGLLDGAAATFRFGKAEFGASGRWSRSGRRASTELDLEAGAAFGDLPRQELYLLGGRGTVPGYPHRSLVGDRFVRAGVVGGVDLAWPWLRGRLFAAAGWTEIGAAGSRAGALLEGGTSGDVKVATGVGVGLFYDLLRIDVARGWSRGGGTQVIVDFSRDFWDFL